MQTIVLLAETGSIPALIGILASLPLWCFRRIRNHLIFIFGLFVLLGALITGLIPVFLADTSVPGFLCILTSTMNLIIYRFYERCIFTIRCPFYAPALHVRSRENGVYRLRRTHCHFYTRWSRMSRQG